MCEYVKETINECLQEDYSLELKDVMKASRKRDYVDLRDMIFTIFRNVTKCSIMDMEREFGFHHATIIHGMRQVKFLCELDSEYSDKFEALKSKINSKIV